MSSPPIRAYGAKTHNHYAITFETVRESTGSGLASGLWSDMKTNQERGRSVRPRPAAEEAKDPWSRLKIEENFFGENGENGPGSRFQVHGSQLKEKLIQGF